jgi:hypothetical protein
MASDSLRRSLSVDFCNDCDDARAPPRASDPRPLRRWGVSARADAFAPAPRPALSSRTACDGLPPFRGEGEQRATLVPPSPSPGPCKTAERWSDGGHRSSWRRVRGGAANPPSVAPRVDEAVTWLRVRADAIGEKVLHRPPGRSREGRHEVPSSDAYRAPLVIGRRFGPEGWSAFRASPDPGPRLGVPREEERRRGNQDAFHLPRTRRAPRALARFALFARGRPFVTPPLPFREVALRSKGTRLFLRSGLPCLPLTVASTRIGSSCLGGGDFVSRPLDTPQRP